jgi:hypothetical protein
MIRHDHRRWVVTALLFCLLGMDRWATDAWLSCPTISRMQAAAPSRSSYSSISMAMNDNGNIGNKNRNVDEQKDIPKSLPLSNPPRRCRRQVLTNMAAVVVGMASGGGWTTAASNPALALVKGNAPPPPKKVGDGTDNNANNKPKCTNVEECQAQAEVREQEARELASQGPPPLVTAAGTKYRDIETGTGGGGGGGGDRVKMGDDVQVYFKVLKLGKRSYDGLSGEGTVVFSRGTWVFRLLHKRVYKKATSQMCGGGGAGVERCPNAVEAHYFCFCFCVLGLYTVPEHDTMHVCMRAWGFTLLQYVWISGYGLEDDEDKPGVTYYQTVVGSPFNIAALNDALIGMQVGGIRRFVILPQKGWEKSTTACDGGPGGRGTVLFCFSSED